MIKNPEKFDYHESTELTQEAKLEQKFRNLLDENFEDSEVPDE